jgi:hypothetical protein
MRTTGNTVYQSSLDSFHCLTSEEPQHLEGVYEKVEDTCRLVIMLKFENKALLILADTDHDTAVVECEDAHSLDLDGYTSINTLLPWRGLLGQVFGWGWLTINQQGYPDGVLLSFDGLVPQILLFVAASSLHVHVVSEASST